MSLQSFLKESKMHAAATLIKTYMFPIYEKFVVFFSNLCNTSNLLGMWFFQLNFFLRIKKVGIPGLISWRKKITVKHADVTWTLLQQKRFPKLWNKLGLNVGWHFLAYHLKRYVLCRIIMAQKNNTLLGCIYIRTGIDRDFQFVSLQELRNEELWFQN